MEISFSDYDIKSLNIMRRAIVVYLEEPVLSTGAAGFVNQSFVHVMHSVLRNVLLKATLTGKLMAEFSITRTLDILR